MNILHVVPDHCLFLLSHMLWSVFNVSRIIRNRKQHLSNRVLHAILHMYLPYKVFENVLMKNKPKIKE